MIKFSPYENLFYLYFTLLLILPCVILCFLKKRVRPLNFIISCIMTVLVFGLMSIQLYEFILFMIFELTLIFSFYFIRKKCKSELLYYILFALSFVPIIFVRISSFNSTISEFVGFAGISYMCFKIWQLFIDIHDEKIENLNLFKLIEVLVFFPSFTSGPITSYTQFNDNYKEDLSNYYKDYFIVGLKKILLGLFYKFALAYFVNTLFMSKIGSEITISNIILYMYAYTLYLFFDFAGYSNMAIGVGYLMGIKLPENFNKPFLACNMKEFWQRWHMSLSNWFNTNVFNRFVLNNVRNGLFKSLKTAALYGYLFTMVLMGLWHGFSIHYIIYGFYEGILLVITEIVVKTKFYKSFKKKKYYKPVSIIFCFQFIAFGMLLFSGKYFFE